MRSVPVRLLGFIVIAMAVPFTAAALYIPRNPGWRNTGWRARHPRVIRALMGPAGADQVGAAFGLVVGAVMIVGGIVAIVIG